MDVHVSSLVNTLLNGKFHYFRYLKKSRNTQKSRILKKWFTHVCLYFLEIVKFLPLENYYFYGNSDSV